MYQVVEPQGKKRMEENDNPHGIIHVQEYLPAFFVSLTSGNRRIGPIISKIDPKRTIMVFKAANYLLNYRLMNALSEILRSMITV